MNHVTGHRVWIFLLGMLAVLARPLAAEEPAFKAFTYKTAKEGSLQIFVHFPPDWKATDKRAAIIFYFGGGWTLTKLPQFIPQADYFAKRGMVAARADYRVRLRHGVEPDACVEDAKSAVRWVRAQAATLGVDPTRIVASGGSSGGHIAACTGTTEGFEAAGEDASISSRPNAMVLFNPVLTFTDPAATGPLGPNASLPERLSPLLAITKATPPTLMLYGTADPGLAEGNIFRDRALALGCRVEMFTAPDQPHGFFNRPPWRERTLARIDEFLTSLNYLPPAKAD